MAEKLSGRAKRRRPLWATGIDRQVSDLERRARWQTKVN